MRIRVTGDVSGCWFDSEGVQHEVQAGTEVDLPDEVAEELVRLGTAVEVVVEREPETTSNEPPVEPEPVI